MTTSAPTSARGAGSTGPPKLRRPGVGANAPWRLPSDGERPGALAPPGGTWSSSSQHFLKLAERTKDAFAGGGESTAEVEHIRKQYEAVHKQYDRAHYEAELKEEQCRKVKEHIRSADALHAQKGDHGDKLEAMRVQYEEELYNTTQMLHATRTNKKVYQHMLARIQKEQAILRQKMLLMDRYKERKDREYTRFDSELKQMGCERVRNTREWEALQQDAKVERRAKEEAREVMGRELERRREANEDRALFEKWRAEIALGAANEAFNDSAGRLRKLYALEKLAGNCLQSTTLEQAQKSEAIEENFMRIREVTGLTDVMDIVHKFLNREEEHKQLDASAKDAGVLLEKLRQDYEALKRDTEGMTFDQYTGDKGDVYKEVERSERRLSEAMEEHEAARARLQRVTLQTEHMQRWAERVGNMLASFEVPAKVQGPADLASYFAWLNVAVKKFVDYVAQQVNDGRITKMDLLTMSKREHDEHKRLLEKGSNFLSGANNRVPLVPEGRPNSRKGASEENPDTNFQEERERCKKETDELIAEKEKEQKAKSKDEGKKEKDQKPNRTRDQKGRE